VPDQNNNAAGLLREAWQEVRGKIKGILWGVALTAGLGLVLLTTELGIGLTNASYDLPFRLLDNTNTYNTLPHEAVVVYLDDSSHQHLHQDYLKPWSRAYYTKLVKRCSADGAKAMVFDIVFSDPMDTNTDQQFADAMRENGNVIIADDWTTGEYGVKGKTAGKVFVPILDLFNAGAAADVGVTTVFPDAGENVRKYKTLITDDAGRQLPSEAWSAAVLVQASFNESNALKNSIFFWLNYYAPETVMPSVSFYKAIADHDPDVPPGFFRNKVVFVGEKLQTYRSGERKDEYSNPFSYRLQEQWYSGVGIHETAYLNIVRGDYLRRVTWERISTIIFGLLCGAILVVCRPVTAVFVAILLALPIISWDYFLFVLHHQWFAWLIPVGVQIPVALIFGVTYNSLKVYAEKVRVEQSLSLYLSPKLVKKFARDPTLLKPGAVKHLLTILFTDIASFTSISEGMDPDELARLMNEYFQTAVQNCIHATDGTVVKYIGDAIFAFWNAPELQSDHAFLACDAALRFRSLKPLKVNGRELVTRLGLHTGVANVGNFGSDTRVDYTAIGENINLASRMEGLNKYTGTVVLITADTQREIGSRLLTRYLGLFRLKGFEKAVGVYELIGRQEQEAETRALRERFAGALEKFGGRDFAGAKAEFNRVLEVNPEDGPTQFYLEQIEELSAAELPTDWKGEITLKDK
jgi:adenylate cyclase